MLRRLALTVSFLAATAAPVIAQTHSGSHAKRYPHGPDHVRPDSATHAAMHALLHGSWTGTLTSAQGASSEMAISVTRDSSKGHLAFTVSTARSKRGVAARDLVMRGDTLRWTQELAGTSCSASARVAPAGTRTLNGRMVCGKDESTFTLQRKAE
jgi:hypothetical protein